MPRPLRTFPQSIGLVPPRTPGSAMVVGEIEAPEPLTRPRHIAISAATGQVVGVGVAMPPVCDGVLAPAPVHSRPHGIVGVLLLPLPPTPPMPLRKPMQICAGTPWQALCPSFSMLVTGLPPPKA